MWFLLFILVGCCLSLPSEPRRQPIPQSDIVPSLSIPGVEFRRARPFSDTPKASLARKGGKHAKLKRLPQSPSHRLPSAAAFFAEHLQFDVVPGIFPTGNVSVVDHSATQYSVEVVLDGSPVNLILDTAGSDTWVRSRNFTCLNNVTEPASRSQCDWGKFGATGFPNGPIQDQHFTIRNADGSGVSGQLGYMDVSLANVAVHNQEVAIATQGTWHGDNITSVINLRLSIRPLFTTMVTDGLVEPYWSLAISRNSSDGLFCLGALPPAVNRSQNHRQGDLLIANLANKNFAAYQPSYYATIFDGFKIGNIDIIESLPLILDSATTLAYLPPDVAEIVNNHFRPAATYLWDYGSYFVPCDATPPRFAVMLQNSPFEINPKDMIKHDVVHPSTGMCQTGITTGASGPYVLGLTFLTNVVVGFDIGGGLIEVIAREYY
ncbi:hypothetical protein PG994_001732 [Apiospora phragmitis]|uniref:Peptidase A1 domain-containing protein n=1 Tax=Apiospora phragmitis TaxID=2905665 RepID=A0ABR1WUH0_9PEZI